jgi:ATP-dependent DNA helicase RecG
MGRVDELGSGILNVYKYLKVYSPRMKPQFIEEQLFRTIIPLDYSFPQRNDAINDAVNEGLSEGLNEGLNEGLKSLLAAVIKNPGVKAKDLPALLENRPLKTIERQIKELVVQKFIERRGSRKTGGYWII